MGKVFGADEIMLGEIPEPGAHTAAAKEVFELLFKGRAFEPGSSEWTYSGIQSGMIHGSSTHGTANIRSDLDVLMIVRSGQDLTLDVVDRVFSSVKQRYHVPIEANILNVVDISERAHSIDPLFLRYLYEAQSNPDFSRNWPADHIGSYFFEQDRRPSALLRVVQRYTSAKTASFAKGLAIGSELDHHKIQRALELPKNMGRKVLSMLDPEFSAWRTPSDEIQSGLEDFIIARRRDERDTSGQLAIDSLRKLTAQDEEYSELLQQTLNGEVDLDTYEKWLEGNKRQLLHSALNVSEGMSWALISYAYERRTAASREEQQDYENTESNKNEQLTLFDEAVVDFFTEYY